MCYRYQHHCQCDWILILLLLLGLHTGCDKTIPHGQESSQPKEVVAAVKIIDDQKDLELIADYKNFDPDPAIKKIAEIMLARHYERAIELLEKIINYYDDKEPSNTKMLPIFLIEITYCHVMLGQAEKGIPYIERACQLMPEESGPFHVSACLFHRLERYDKAIERYQKAIELQKKTNPYFFSPEEQGYYCGLFMAYNNKGDLRSAYDVYKTIKSRLDGYQFHVEPATKGLIQYFAEVNDDNWESMPRYRVSKKLPPHPKEIDDPSTPSNKRTIFYKINVQFEPIDDAPK